MKNKSNLFVVLTAAVFLFGLTIFGILSPDKEFSVSERRPLAAFPKITAEKVFSGRFSEEFEKYSLDNFPLRDGFRRVKALASYCVFGQKDNNGLYYADGYLSKLEYPEDLDSVKKATDRFLEIVETYADEESKVYFSVIPDKNYFLAEKNGYPAINYDKFIAYAKEGMSSAEYIDITDLLELDDYYRTDSHWRQERITDVAERLAEKMGAKLDSEYAVNKLSSDFYGVYSGQSALPVRPDELYCLEIEAIKNSTVYDAETDSSITVYNKENVFGKDPYEVFLHGSKSLLKIENPNSVTDKKLIVFRDSFANSLAPLLISGYSEITLVDIRYISPKLLERFMDFEGRDILFLYSTGVLNNSITIK